MTEHPHDTEERAQARRVALIRAAVEKHSNGERPASGIMGCPACEGGDVAYSVSGNGRIFANCSTRGCCDGWLP